MCSLAESNTHLSHGCVDTQKFHCTCSRDDIVVLELRILDGLTKVDQSEVIVVKYGAT